MSAINHLSARALLGQLTFALVALAAPFAPSSFAIPGDLYVTDLTSNSISVFAFDGSVTNFVSGLDQPQGIVLDPDANVYVCESGSGNILKFSPEGTQTVFATGLSNPIGLAFDGFYLLVAENGADVVTRVAPDGSKTPFQTVTAPKGVAFKNGSAYIAHENAVLKVAADMSTNDFDIGSGTRDVQVISNLVDDMLVDTVFVSTDADEIDEIAPDGTVMQFAPGQPLSDPMGMAFRPARFSGDTDGVGNLYVGERSVGNIVQFTKTGDETLFATSGNPNFMAFEAGVISPTPTPTPSGKALNISTRVDVESGDNVAIGGFIITGTEPKLVVLRTIGPSLVDHGVSGAIADPMLELHDANGVLASNDNWMDNSAEDQAILTDNNLAPSDPLESALVMTLAPGQYTVIVSGVNGATGVALVEAYDLDDPTALGEFGNISTRGLVGTEANVLIGGIIIGPDVGTDASVVLRAIGPSLVDHGVSGAIADPMLELHDANGVLASNDNWMDNSAEDQVILTDNNLAPPDPLESALVMTLAPGQYTVIVSGVNGATGVALVEAYHVATP